MSKPVRAPEPYVSLGVPTLLASWPYFVRATKTIYLTISRRFRKSYDLEAVLRESEIKVELFAWSS